MKALLEFLDGIKTYLIVAVILALCVLHWAGKITMPPEAYAALFAIGLAALRAGVSKSGPILLAGALLVGCATPISDSTLTRIGVVAQGAAAIGVAADLSVRPADKAIVLEVQTQLDALAASPAPTSAQLAAIIAGKLPMGDKAQWLNGALVLWGVTEGFWTAPNTSEAVRAAARGLSLGITQGLAALNIKTTLLVAANTNAPPKLPAPTPKNTKKV